LTVSHRPIRRGIVRLQVSQFRSWPSFALRTDTRSVALAGPNGAGKTNLLEALSLLGPGRGLRHAPLMDMVTAPSAQKAPWSVFAEISLGSGQSMAVASRLDPKALQGGAERRQIWLEGALLPAHGDVLDHVWVMALTPRMDGLLRDGAEGRRRFLDQIVEGLDPAHHHDLARYTHAVRERQVVLKQARPDPGWLSVLEDRMARAGVAVAARRLDRVASLQARILSADLARFPRPELRCQGVLEQWLEEGPGLCAEERARALWEQQREQDRQAGQCLAGPHRSDVMVVHRGSGRPARMCSTGEQKALLVTWILAAVALFRENRDGVPLLLLDEVMAHLDEQRRIDFFGELDRLEVQSWMTGTDLSFFRPLGDRVQCFDLGALPLVMSGPG
jgi:DNA replication and repair protein RecF